MSEIDQYLNSVTFTPAVVGYLRENSSDLVCLIERKKVSGGLGQDLVAGIGGKVGDSPEIQDETPDEAMDRETNEEVGDKETGGIKVLEKTSMGRVRFIFTHKPLDSTWNQDVQIYTISRWEGTPTETESAKPVWFKIGEIPWERMWEDNQQWLPKVLSGQRVNAIFLFSDDNKIAESRFEDQT